MKHKDNTKQLYKLVVSLTGWVADNPMPKCDSTVELCECFVDFFITKIESIRSNLGQHPLYQYVVNEAMPKLEVFKTLSHIDIKKVNYAHVKLKVVSQILY